MSTNIKKRVPVVLITGYLGSGKTTLMQHILQQEQRKVALIVNDMGSINIDASLISRTGNQVVQVEMVELQNGCICCTLRDEFMAEIERLAKDETIEAIFVEASGISEPSSIAGAFMMYAEECPVSRVFLKTIVSVVDADRIYREFLHDLESEAATDKSAADASAVEDGDIINLIMDQIEFCNLMILNKTDPDGKALEKAVFALWQKIYPEAGETVPEGAATGSDEGGTFYWKEFKTQLTTDGNGQIVVTDLPLGSYQFTEEKAPDGFIKLSEPVSFQITRAGQTAVVNGVYVPAISKNIVQ